MSTERDTSNPRSFPYALRSFPVRLADGLVPDEVARWSQAVSLGFYGNVPSEADLEKYATMEQVDGRMATGAYLIDAATPAGAWGPEYPVATYAYHRKNLNVGGGTLLPVHQIMAVTVRPSHRRRGILRAMISSDLAQAKAAGIPLAALTASEATIYGRFGFGVATQACTVEVASRGGIAFHNPGAASQGTVEVAEVLLVRDLHNEIFSRVHAATYGSIGRQDMYRLLASGQVSYASMEPARNIRAAMHYDSTGAVDGYVTYKPDEDATPATVTIVDLLAAGEGAYLALWNYLGSLDLIERITWDMAPEVDSLEWAMAARRDYKRTGTEDHLWLRILDVPAALAGRKYWAEGTVQFQVTDPLGHVSGVYRLSVKAGTATVHALSQDPTGELPDPATQVVLGVSELSSLYLGGVSARTLAAAGRITVLHPGGADALDALFQSPVRAHALTDF
ncbi:GNAT family N-acetyltransferase [Specibacter sp. RAF43]|uniref:GNAT family N-acetyltransferase n=1 Tax=Specibacter sp. RAF43 TaxID=3233057 RepID=UPI003F9B771B